MSNYNSVFTQSIKTKFIDEFVSDVASSSSNYYLCFGGSNQWSDPNNPYIDDQNPPVPDASITSSHYNVLANILFGKKVSVSDIAYMARNIVWESGKIYDYYSDTDPSLYSKNFFVINSKGYVYKCLFNNYGMPSTVMPSSTSVQGDFKTADGYVWKYMFYLTSINQKKFSTSNFIPVNTEPQVLFYAENGAIHIMTVQNSATGYPNANGNIVSFQSGNPNILQIQNQGASSISGEYNTAAIYIYSGTGAGTYAQIQNYVVNTAGKFVYAGTGTLDITSKYIISPYVSIVGDGTQAVAYAVVNNSTTAVDSIQVINRGINYTNASVSLISNSSFVTGTSLVNAIISPPGGHGSNPRYELGCDTTGLSIAVLPSDNFPISIDYRQLSLINNPKAFANNALFTAPTFSQLTKINVDNFSSLFNSGETITGSISGATATVLNSSTTQLILFNVSGTFVINETLTGSSTGSTCTASAIILNDWIKNTGEVYYYRNFSPVTRSASSLEQVKLFFKI